MPAWKSEFIGEAIDSILHQTYKDFELVVVDDCSPAGIERIVSEFSDKRLTYCRNEKNIGGNNLVTQWNHCLSYAKGEYIILATDDDLYEPDFLNTFHTLIVKYPQVNVFRSRILSVNSRSDIVGVDRCYKEYLTQSEFFYYYFQGLKGGIPQFIFKKEKLLSRGGFIQFDLAWGSDDATVLACADKGIVNSQEMLVKFRWSNLNISNKKGRDMQIRKANARIQLCKWLRKEIRKVRFGDTPIDVFCREQTIGLLDVHLKLILLKEFVNFNLFDFLFQMIEVHRSGVLPIKHEISMFYRYIKA